MSDIDREALDALLSGVDLVHLIEMRSPTRFGKPAGIGENRAVKGPCPWCGGEDRFAVFIGGDKQEYYCGIHKAAGCYKKGDAISFLREYEHMSWGRAIEELKGKLEDLVRPTDYVATGGVEDYQCDSWQRRVDDIVKASKDRLHSDQGQGVLAYLHGRGLANDTIEKARLGMVERFARHDHKVVPHLVIPWYSIERGIYVRITYRDIRTGIPSKARYDVHKGGANDDLYLSDVLPSGRPVFLFEGELDALSFIQATDGRVAAVATGSTAANRTTRSIVKLAIMPHVFIAFDSEPKGEKAAQYWLNVLRNSSRWCTPLGKDANEALQAGLDLQAWVEAALSTIELPEAEPEIREETATEEPKIVPAEPGFPDVIEGLRAYLTKETGEEWKVTLLPEGTTHEQYLIAQGYHPKPRHACRFCKDEETQWIWGELDQDWICFGCLSPAAKPVTLEKAPLAGMQKGKIEVSHAYNGCACQDCDECAARAELLAWGSEHGWPIMYVRPWLAIPSGEEYWHLYSVKHALADLKQAVAATRGVAL